MGRLTEDMRRLCDEIQTLHGSRQALKGQLASGHANRQEEVSEMCAQFSEMQTRVAQQARRARLAFLSNLRHLVAELRQQTQVDLAVVRFAWAGKRR
ncbi:MAG: hypothetical protein LAP13_00540 [Acidobacteriia bacterium]|nr:hypothetical protein [Terriglobia bacterium]